MQWEGFFPLWGLRPLAPQFLGVRSSQSGKGGLVCGERGLRSGEGVLEGLGRED